MIDPESKESMQENSEGSLGCLKSKTVFYNSQDVGNPSQVFPESMVEINDKSGAGTLESRKSIIRDSSLPPNGSYNRSFYQQQFCMWPTFYPEKVHQNQWNFVESHLYASGQDYHLPIENRMQYVPFKVFSPGHPHDFQCQEFQYFVVIDFEATCDKERIPFPQEIIEFPSVLVNSVTGQLEASFQTYVRPAYHQLLTDFCKDLTGIQQIQVDRGVPLSEALLMHDRWLEEKGIKHTNFAVVTWSNWDCRVMLESECKFKRIRKPPYFNRWINLKVPFQEVYGGVRCNLKEAVKLAGLAWEGRAHCGLDDARNTARLLALLMHRGFRFSITNTLMWPHSDSPTPWQPSPDHLPATFIPHQKLKQLMDPPPLFHNPLENERRTYCFCGVTSSKRMVRKPGPKHGRHFYGCGNWTITRGALCPYFEWAS